MTQHRVVVLPVRGPFVTLGWQPAVNREPLWTPVTGDPQTSGTYAMTASSLLGTWTSLPAEDKQLIPAGEVNLHIDSLDVPLLATLHLFVYLADREARESRAIRLREFKLTTLPVDYMDAATLMLVKLLMDGSAVNGWLVEGSDGSGVGDRCLQLTRARRPSDDH